MYLHVHKLKVARKYTNIPLNQNTKNFPASFEFWPEEENQ
jgi:hypothetical protein